MVEIITSVAAKVAEYLVAPVKRQFSYLYNHKSNFDNLNEDIQKLKDARENVQRKLVNATGQGEEIKQHVNEWRDSVNKIIDEARMFIEDEENNKAKNQCFKGFCPNLMTRYKQTKETSRKMEVVARLLEEEGTFHNVSDPTIPEDIWLTYNKGYEAFESRNSTLKNIMNALNDVNVDMIGVSGIGGAGKTTLVKEAARQAKKGKLFDEVIFVKVSQTPDIKKIEEEIASKLGLEFWNNAAERARRLYARLKKENKILRILDNIWTSLDLEHVGIPFGDDHKGCKLLLTARCQDVLSCKMDSQKNFVVGVLNEVEAWRLFKKMAGDYVENSNLKSIAFAIAKECGGLPIAIVTVAKALKRKSVSEWKDALRELKRPSPANFKGVLEEAYSKIELSYNYLKGKELKKTFLLCSLMEHHASISDLFKYVMGLDILEGDIPDMEQARNRVDKLVRELKDSCLLLDNHTNNWFSMHDVVRSVAISLAYRDQHVFTMRNDVLKEWPKKDELNKCTKISFSDSNIIELPESLECLQLAFFYVDFKDSSFKIPENFFCRDAKAQSFGFY